MNAPLDLPPGPAGHFQLWYYAALLRLLERLADAVGGPAEDDFPFLAGYVAELARQGARPDEPGATARWVERIIAWERGVAGRLPLRALASAAGLGADGLLLLLGAGLIEEDERLGDLFAAIQGEGRRRPSAGLLTGWWLAEIGDPRAALARLLDQGLLRVANPDAPRAEWQLSSPPLLWDCLRLSPAGQLAPWLEHRPAATLPTPAELLLPDPAAAALAGLPGLLAGGVAAALILRGPRHNGRRTFAGAVARALGRGLLLADQGALVDDRWRQLGPLASTLNAVPSIVLSLAPGELAELPALSGYTGPLLVIAGPQGGLQGPPVERAVALSLELPGPDLRRRHWQAALAPAEQSLAAPLAERLRLTGGNIRRAAAGARAVAALEGRVAIGPADVRAACRALSRQTLETLASPLPLAADAASFRADDATVRELALLAARCRRRERLGDHLGAAFAGAQTCGVRALFSGPSGTGKTMAARRLAADLDLDLYRVDLSAVINKYIGETEKNLERVFACAEELDVMLLLDEGDALLTRRTSVQSSNDRYANLETNFLLQRLESFSGILIVTTNAAQRIDDAFQRRMDVVISFAMPDPEERLAIWLAHLPTTHGVPADLLEDLAYSCALSGGQVRGAALYAALLALEEGRSLGADHLESAVRREYRKSGAVCPLPAGEGRS